MLALIGQERAHVNGEVHLIREPRQERQHQFVVIGWRDEIRRQPIALAEIVCQKEDKQKINCLCFYRFPEETVTGHVPGRWFETHKPSHVPSYLLNFSPPKKIYISLYKTL